MQGRYSIRTHQGETGLFAEIELNAEFLRREEADASIQFTFSESVPDILEACIKFGCYNALEKLPVHFTDQRLHITIQQVRWHAIDTFPALLAMAAGRALINAFKKEDELQYPVREVKNIIFSMDNSVSDFI